MSALRLSLPYPPSANRLWRAVQGRNIKSAEYRAWLHTAATWARVKYREALSGPYAITIAVDRPDRRRRDLGNIEKPISDALVQAALIRDDSDCQRLTVFWSDRAPGEGALVHVEIEATV